VRAFLDTVGCSQDRSLGDQCWDAIGNTRTKYRSPFSAWTTPWTCKQYANYYRKHPNAAQDEGYRMCAGLAEACATDTRNACAAAGTPRAD
jgi:hypothetical protein